MNYRLFNILSASLAAVIAVGSICIYECGSANDTRLQSPSLLGPGTVDFFERQFMDDEPLETGVVTVSLGNPNVSIKDYTFVATTSFADVKIDYGNDPTDPVTYDGAVYWLKVDTSLVSPMLPESSDAKTKKNEPVPEIKLKIGDSFRRISYTKEWSLVKLADGTTGYLKNSDLSATLITPVPTNTPTPKPTPKPKKKASSSSSSTKANNNVKEKKVSKTVYATCALNTRSGPGISYSLLSTLKSGAKISVVAETDNGWLKSSSGYYVKASLTSSSAPSGGGGGGGSSSSSSSSSSSGGGGGSSSKVGDKSGDFAKYVRSFIGCKYVAGGSSPSKGFDCSGFVMYCFKNYYNVSLPHGATSQSKKGKEVSKDDIQCGDIICFDRNGDGTMEHSAIYIGGGKYVHAKGKAYGVVEDNFSSAKNVAHIRRVI